MMFLVRGNLVMNTPASDVGCFYGRLQVLGQVIEHGIKVLPLKKPFRVLLSASFPMYGLLTTLFDLIPRVNMRDNADNSLLIVEFEAFSSCRKVMYAVTLSPGISTAR